MQIVVLPRAAASEFSSKDPWAAISISDNNDWPNLSEGNRLDLLRLSFLDADDDDSINEGQAGQILDFVRSNFCKIDTLLIHCLMGQSRSPGVAAAIYRLLTNGDDSYFFKRYTPNRKVYSTILKVAHDRGYHGGKFIAET